MGEESTFTPEGRTPFPSLYQDNLQVREFSTWSTQALNDHFQEYNAFLQGNNMPRAQEETRRVLQHIIFELGYREGLYE